MEREACLLFTQSAEVACSSRCCYLFIVRHSSYSRLKLHFIFHSRALRHPKVPIFCTFYDPSLMSDCKSGLKSRVLRVFQAARTAPIDFN